MANPSPGMTNFFRNAVKNRLAMVPANMNLVSFANKNESEAYNSRVLASQTNGAQMVSDPIDAPWSFTDFVFGTKSLAKPATPGRVNRGIGFRPRG